MITAKAFAGKHYAVLGLGRSGVATVNALLASGARVTAWDDKLSPSPQRGESRGEGLRRSSEISSAEHPHPTLSLQGEGLIVADFLNGDLTAFDSIIVTPGLPLNHHPIRQAAEAAGVEIIGDIELFARARPELPPHKVLGITGTNGKSTTTALIHHILKTAGVPTTMGGNIGLPILGQEPLLMNDAGVGVYVLELSSYQIDLIKSLHCNVAVLLNVTPDHLDRYVDFAAYELSKRRLLEMAYGGVAIDLTQKAYGDLSAVCIAPDIILGSGIHSKENILTRQAEWTSLQGPHNLQNAEAAVFACRAIGLSDAEIAPGLRTYPGLPHRMERVREKEGVLFVNDSKATNAEAAAPALAAYPRVRWIVGGQAKTHELGDTANHLDHVARAYTIGEAGPMFAALLRDHKVDVIECETLENAVKNAAGDSQAGDTVLLSPACASFDQFRDFEARGDRFRELVEGL